jgi:hypothetical protein
VYRAAQHPSSREVGRVGKRHPNFRLVKTHRSYTVGETAQLFRLHKNTVRKWTKEGLESIDDQRPVIFDGKTLAAFLQSRRARAKSPCAPGQIYCVACRAPQEPALNMADYLPVTATSGNLRGLCPTCGRLMHRRVSNARLLTIAGKLQITVTDASVRITETGRPSVRCDVNPPGET